MTWIASVPIERLRHEGKLATKLGGRQLALFLRDGEVFACNNRCPHEGYPLAEGSLDAACVLTCNWHNWKFDLRSGDTIIGGDRLRIYPVKLVDGVVWIDITDPSPEERRADASRALHDAVDKHDYDRIARELARFARAGGDMLDGLREAIARAHDRLEFGTSHALAASECWVRLHDGIDAEAPRLATLVEAIGHIGWDVLRERQFPFADTIAVYSAPTLLAAIEAQDEAAAVAQLRGALAQGLGIAALEPVLTEAALGHYADFGHSLIYVMHARRLIARLGPAVETPLLLALLRSLINASREDLVPEFRDYADSLRDWPTTGAGSALPLEPAALIGRSARDSLARLVAAAQDAPIRALFDALLGANALNMLRFDLAHQARSDNGVDANVGWLDFTHGLTFANAVRVQCDRFPSLWPAGLLQMACFVGRNAGYTDAALPLETWRVGDQGAFFARLGERLLDHGERDYIHSAHYLKTYCAVREEVEAGLPPDIEALMLAALHRFFDSPLKRKHVLRNARQALAFVAREE